MRSISSVSLSLAALLVLAACGGSDGGPSGPPSPGPPATIATSGSAQSGGAGSALPAPVTVTVRDAAGRAVPGAVVAWSTLDGSIAPSNGITDAGGSAQATWTLAPRLGAQSASVAVGSLTAAFTAQATLPPTTSFLRVGGHGQTASAGARLPDTLVVEVRLPSGATLRDVPVTWTAGTGSGAVTPLSGTTDAQGRARAVWTLGPATGEQTVNVASAGLATIAFTATAIAGSPAQITLSADSLLMDQWADTARFTAMVRDANNNPTTASIVWSSSDTTVARVSTSGLITSNMAGRAVITASVGTISASRPVRVVLQRNGLCRIPTPSSRGAAAGIPGFGTDAIILTNLTSPSFAGSRTLALDYDGDGDQDAVRLEYSYPGSNPYSGTTRVFRNDAGTLVDATSAVLTVNVIPDHPRDFEIADFTGDGVADLYVAQHGFDAVPFPGTRNLFFTRQGAQLSERFSSSFSPAPSDAFSHGSSSADVDCDGDVDIVELNVTPTRPNFLFLNNGAGSFTAAPMTAFPIGGQGDAGGQVWQEVAFIDFDNDGDPDMFLGARSGANWNQDAFLVNDGFGRFRRAPIGLPAGRYAPNRAINNVKAADFNGDGLQDLFVLEIPQPFSTTSAMRLLINRGNGSFADESVAFGLPQSCNGEVIEPLFVTDFNRDSWPDVVVPPGCSNLGGTGILFNTGSRFDFFSFGSIQPWLAQDFMTPLDIDRDGDPDLFFGDRGGNPVLVRNPR